MKKAYKNKRDYYKSQMDIYRARVVSLESEFNKSSNLDNKPKPRVSVKWFCKRCRVVATGTVPQGIDIETCHCDCGGELLAVSKLPYGF